MFHIQQQKLSGVFLAQNSATGHKLKCIYIYSHRICEKEMKKMYRPASVHNIFLKTKPCERMVFLIFWVILKNHIFTVYNQKLWPHLKRVKCLKFLYFKTIFFLKCVSQNYDTMISNVQINYSSDSKLFNGFILDITESLHLLALNLSIIQISTGFTFYFKILIRFHIF